MSTLIEKWLSKATDEELCDIHRELEETVLTDSPYAEDWLRLLRAVQAEQGRRIAVTTPPGCCSNCKGTGRDAGAPETGGLCWDCHGTGHTHAPEETCSAME